MAGEPGNKDVQGLGSQSPLDDLSPPQGRTDLHRVGVASALFAVCRRCAALRRMHSVPHIDLVWGQVIWPGCGLM